MEFSKEQKDFLKKFVINETREGISNAHSPFWLPNIILDVAEIVKIEWRYDNENSSARSLEVSYEKNNPKYKGIYSVFDWMHFFNYLRNNNYVSVLTMADKPKDGKYNFSINDDNIRVDQGKYRERHPNEIDCENIENIEICELKDLWCECIYPRPLLGELVARDFKTQEQVRFETEMMETKKMFKANMKATKDMFKKNICYTKWMLGVALFSSLLALFIGLLSGNTETDHQQHKELINAIQSTSINTTQIEIIKPIPIETSLKKESGK